MKMLNVIEQTILENIKNNEKFVSVVQKIVDRTLDKIRNESEDWGLGEMDELDEINSIDSIIVKDIYKKNDKLRIPVTLYKNTQRLDFENVLSSINYEVSKMLGDCFVVIEDTVDTRNFGPGIDW